jgi:hypothetical protein
MTIAKRIAFVTGGNIQCLCFCLASALVQKRQRTFIHISIFQRSLSRGATWGWPPQEMEGRIVTVCERALTTTVNDIEHTESESYQGVAVIRVFFQPPVKVELAISQITAVVQTILGVLPPGTFPPNILKYEGHLASQCGWCRPSPLGH